MKIRQYCMMHLRINLKRSVLPATGLVCMMAIFAMAFTRPAVAADAVAINIDSVWPNPSAINEEVTIKLSADATGETHQRPHGKAQLHTENDLTGQ